MSRPILICIFEKSNEEAFSDKDVSDATGLTCLHYAPEIGQKAKDVLELGFSSSCLVIEAIFHHHVWFSLNDLSSS